MNDDKEFFELVKNIANGSKHSRDNVLKAAGYLWDGSNWERLKETSHGRFLREVHNECTDYTLQRMYREEILK